MSRIRILPYIGRAILNHAGVHGDDVEGVYDRYTYLPEKTAALEDWGETALALLEQRASNVAAMRRARQQREHEAMPLGDNVTALPGVHA